MRSVTTALEMLIVEDNPADVELFHTFFRQQPRATRFHVVHDGEEALDFMWRRGKHSEAPRPDLIIMDINVPKIDGKDVLREIKACPGLRSIPILVLTSSENDEDVRQSYDYGANCVLIKATDIDGVARLYELMEAFWVNTVKLPEK